MRLSKIEGYILAVTIHCKQNFVQTMTNHTLQKRIFQSATYLIGVAIILGAFGAHALKNRLTEGELQTFQTGVNYQFIHGMALLALSLGMRRLNEKSIALVHKLFMLGIGFFSGSLYLLSVGNLFSFDPFLKNIGMITPIGGILFITGWFYLATKGYKSSEESSRHERSRIKERHSDSAT